MSEGVQQWALFFQLAIQIGTPILFAVLGGILNEKVGHLNLGIEGAMLLGAAFGFVTAYYTQNVLLALLVAGFSGMFAMLIYAVITVTLQGNQTVTGFAITILGTGVANLLGKPYAGLVLPPEFTSAISVKPLAFLSGVPFLGDAIFYQSLYVLCAPILAIVLWVFLKKTKPGLYVRMVGENPAAADASGINVARVKYMSILSGGFLCGIGGGYLSLVYIARWQDSITAGMGWIAVALIIFSTWSPTKAIYSAYLFGILKALSIKFQGGSFAVLGLNITISSQIMDMLPYAATVVVLIFATALNKHSKGAPAALGRAYFREDR